MASFDDNNDGVIDAKEAVDVAEDIAKKTAAEREAQKEATRERKISQVFRRFAMVLVLALLASVGINAGLTAAVVYAVKDTEVDGVLLVSSDTGDVLKVGSAEFGTRPFVAPDEESEEAATPWHRDPNATTTVFVDANGGAVATAAATDRLGVLVDAGGAAVKTQAAEYKAFDLPRFLLDAAPDVLEGLKKFRPELPGGRHAELSITGSASRTLPVFGIHPADNASYWTTIGPLEPQATKPLELTLKVVLLEASSTAYRGGAAFELADPTDADAAPLLAMKMLSQRELDSLSQLISVDVDDDNINTVMNQMVLEEHPLLDLSRNGSLVDGALRGHGRKLFFNAIAGFFTSAFNWIVDGIKWIACQAGKALASIIRTVINALTDHLVKPIANFACTQIAAPVANAVSKMGEICADPTAGACAGGGGVQPIELFKVPAESDNPNLLVTAKPAFKACAKVTESRIECAI